MRRPWRSWDTRGTLRGPHLTTHGGRQKVPHGKMDWDLGARRNPRGGKGVNDEALQRQRRRQRLLLSRILHSLLQLEDEYDDAEHEEQREE